ncbi:hypothetical protein HDU98_008322 [Podochytrium sp. JEL0797]|nr:hypothetical protein HDU98_008322 [Podochytrium sp. JEL0797]
MSLEKVGNYIVIHAADVMKLFAPSTDKTVEHLRTVAQKVPEATKPFLVGNFSASTHKPASKVLINGTLRAKHVVLWLVDHGERVECGHTVIERVMTPVHKGQRYISFKIYEGRVPGLQYMDPCDRNIRHLGTVSSDDMDPDMLQENGGEPPIDPVVSRHTGILYERGLIVKFIADGGREPGTDHELTEADLISVKGTPKTVRPRPPTANSIPALLLLLQNEYDATMLETFQLKTQHHQLRQELSTALYENDAAKRVIARLAKERDVARQALAAVQAASGFSEPAVPEQDENSMDVDAAEPEVVQAVPKEIADTLDETAAALSKSRKKRKAPTGTATLDEIKSFTQQSEIPSLHSTTHPGITSLSLLNLPSTQPEKQNWVLSGGNDGSVLINDWQSGNQIASVKAHGAKKVSCVEWVQQGDHAGRMFVSGSVDNTVKVWNVKEDGDSWSVGKASHVIKGHSSDVTDVAVHPSGLYGVSASLDSSWAFLDLVKGVQVSKTVHPDGQEAYSSIAMHPDGLIIGTGTTDSIIRIWELKSSKNVATFSDSAKQLVGKISSMSFSENGYYFATASADACVVKLWDLRKLENFQTLEMCAGAAGYAGKKGVNKVQFDYGAGFLGVACCDSISIFRNKQWDEVIKFTPGNGVVSDFQFGGYSKWIASASSSERKVVVTGAPAAQE